MIIEYQLPKHGQPFFGFIKGICRIFMRKVRVVNLGGELQNKCLYLANHANKMGPFVYETYFPLYAVKWGAHQMLGSYKQRREYLRDVLYIQKNGTGKARASFKSFFEAYFSKFFYKGMKFLPTYPDMRLVKTVKKSVEVLNDDTALMIFPENSDKGYNAEMQSFFSGFVLVMENYFKRGGEDVPVRAVYYHKKKRIMVVGESVYLSDFTKEGLNRNEIAEIMKDKMNALYHRIESGEFDKKSKKSSR